VGQPSYLAKPFKFTKEKHRRVRFLKPELPRIGTQRHGALAHASTSRSRLHLAVAGADRGTWWIGPGRSLDVPGPAATYPCNGPTPSSDLDIIVGIVAVGLAMVSPSMPLRRACRGNTGRGRRAHAAEDANLVLCAEAIRNGPPHAGAELRPRTSSRAGSHMGCVMRPGRMDSCWRTVGTLPTRAHRRQGALVRALIDDPSAWEATSSQRCRPAGR